MHISTHKLYYSLSQHLCNSTAKSGVSLGIESTVSCGWTLLAVTFCKVSIDQWVSSLYTDINHLLVFTWKAVWEDSGAASGLNRKILQSFITMIVSVGRQIDAIGIQYNICWLFLLCITWLFSFKVAFYNVVYSCRNHCDWTHGQLWDI